MMPLAWAGAFLTSGICINNNRPGKLLVVIRCKIAKFDLMRHFLLFFLLLGPVLLPAQQLLETQWLGPDADAVGQWRTIEVGVRAPASDRRFRQFIAAQPGGINPYNRANFNLRAVFSCGTLRDTVQAFWFEQPVANRAANRYDTEAADWPWRIRFAPPSVGEWTLQLLTAPVGEPAAPSPTTIRFRCVPSDRHGWLQVAPNKRRLQFMDGTPFFAIGQNIAWPEAPVLIGHSGPKPVYIAGFEDVYHYINHLADCGGNFVRLFMSPWGTGLEWEQVGLYRQDRAAALDSMIALCEARGLFVQLNFELTKGYDGPPYAWENHPLRIALGITDKLQLLTNDSAVALHKQLVRYLHARWGHTPHVAIYELINEMDGWPDFDNRRALFADWHTKTISFIRNELADECHLITSSFATPPYGAFYELPGIQLTQIHHYTNDLNDNRNRWKILNGKGLVGEKKGILSWYDKPSLVMELGLINGPVNAADADDITICNDVSFHNSLWAITFSGTLGTGMNWWQWHSDAYRTANFPPLVAFLKNVPMDQLTQPGMNQSNGLEAFWSSNVQGTQAAGWLHNQSYWWANMSEGCRDRHGNQMFPPRDDDKAKTPENRAGKQISVSGLARNRVYVLTYTSTRATGKLLVTETARSSRTGRITLTLPPDVADCAFHIRLKSGPHDGGGPNF